MKVTITKTTFLLYMIFFIPIIFDLLYGFLNVFLNISLPISAIYRSIVMVTLLNIILFNWFNFKTFLKSYFLMIIFIFYIFDFFWIILFDNYNILREFQQFSRIVYPYILLLYLIFLMFKNKLNIFKIFNLLLLSGFIAAVSIYFSYFTGYGLKTYGNYSFATSSFFSAQNDITLSLLITISISMYLYLLKNKIIYLYNSFFIVGSLVFLGTRAGSIGGFGIILIYIFAMLIIKKGIKISTLKKIIIFILITTSLVYITSLIIELISKYQYMIDKYLLILEETPRAKLEEAGRKVLEGRTIIENFIGQGSSLFSFEVEKYYPSKKIYIYGKFVEQDILDFIGSYGYLLGTILLLFPIFLLSKLIILFYKYKNIDIFFLIVTMNLFIVHSFFVGHALNSPTVSSFIVPIYISALYYKNIFIKGKR